MQSEPKGAVLGWGVFVAGLAQMVFLLFFARSTCGPFRPQWGWRDSKVRRILTLMVPVIIGSSAAQVGVVLDTILASFLVSGSISWLNFSQRLMEFPLGVFGVALATVALPRLSRLHAAGGTRRVPGVHGLGDPFGSSDFSALRRRAVHPRGADHGYAVPRREVQPPGC